MDEQSSLFDLIDQTPDEKEKVLSGKLNVVKMEYIQAESVIWQDLFSGYSKIRAITYSSGIDFIYKLIDLFSDVEIIFGCEDIISNSLNEIMAYQSKLIERLRECAREKKKALLDRIDNGSVRFYVVRTKISHEKTYLLESDSGAKRVIMGSANMSFRAFGGIQRENICYVDGDAAFEWYNSVFEDLRNDSTDQITKTAFSLADAKDNIDELPIAQTVKAKKVMYIEPDIEDKADIKFILDTKELSKKLKPLMPRPEKKGKKMLLSPDKMIKIKQNVQHEQQKERELRSEYPQLKIDIDDKTVSLNGVPLDLNPTDEAIRSDVAQFLKYMDGYSRFHGDREGLQFRYYEFANWFFCSPFMAPMRDMAARFDQNRLPYPVFGLVYGQSKAGKTSFLETLLLMMIGQKPKVSAPEFTRSSIETLKRTVQGAPIIVDDLTNQRFNQHAIETIKNDDFGVAEHMVTYSAVVISANEDVKAVAPEVIRRTVICRVEAGLTNTEVLKNNVVRSVQRSIGTAFYREYLRQMLDAIPELISMLQGDDEESPDILKTSSEVIRGIIKEYGTETLPPYVVDLSLENYFSESVTGKYAIKQINNAWKTSKDSFEIKKKDNELRYNAGAPYEADRLIKELPETLEPRKSRDWIVMKLDEAQDFFGLPFKKSWMPWKK